MEDVLIRFRLIDSEARALNKLAAQELRHPRDQVRFLVRAELERLGLLPVEHKNESEVVPYEMQKVE